jgi:hypothetical protein
MTALLGLLVLGFFASFVHEIAGRRVAGLVVLIGACLVVAFTEPRLDCGGWHSDRPLVETVGQ